MSDVNTANDFAFAGGGDVLIPLLSVKITTREQAYRTAAWIETMGIILPHEEEEATYEEIREAIRNT